MKQTPHILVNGKVETSISVLDRGLAYGDGAFETMLVDNKTIALWQYHHERITSALKTLRIQIKDYQIEEKLHLALQCIDKSKGVLKLMVTRGEGGRGYSPVGQIEPNIITIYNANTDQKECDDQRKYSQGIRVHCCEQTLPCNASTAGLKSLNQLVYVLASQECMVDDIDEGLLFTEAGHLIEATARNVFIINNGELYTPLLNQCGVSGVMHRLIIDKVAPQNNIVVRQQLLTKKDLLHAEEVFVCNSVTGIWPVISCENKQWSVGPITQKLQQSIYEFLKQNTSLEYRY